MSKHPTPAEREERRIKVIRMLANGCTSKDIAVGLGISTPAAIAVRITILKDLGLHNAAALVNYAYQNGILKVTPTPKKP